MKKIFAFALSIILLFSMTFVASAVEFPELKVSLSSSEESVDVGEEVKVTLAFNNASKYPFGLAAFCSFLTYDANVLKLKSVSAAVPRSSIRNNSLSGELRSVYTFASAQKKPGFNTDGPFYTVTFEAIGSGNSTVNVTFDAVTVTDYNTDELNFKVGFNSPSVIVKVNGDEGDSTGDTSSAVSSNKTSSAVSSNKTSSAVSSNKTSAEETSSKQDVNSTEVQNSDSSTQTGKNEFFDVADSGQDTVQDYFDESGEIIEQTESKAPNKPSSSNTTQADIDEIDDSETNGIPNAFVLVGAIGLVVLVGAVVAVVIIKKKK